MENNNPELHQSFGSDGLYDMFIEHLNRVYCAKSHLAERFTEIAEEAGFADLRESISLTMQHIEKQVANIDKIYAYLGEEQSFERCSEVISFLEKAFLTIQQQTDDFKLRDLYVLSYLIYIESIEADSFKILRIAAHKNQDKKLQLMLKGCYEEAKIERRLLSELTSKYALTE